MKEKKKATGFRVGAFGSCNLLGLNGAWSWQVTVVILPTSCTEVKWRKRLTRA